MTLKDIADMILEQDRLIFNCRCMQAKAYNNYCNECKARRRVIVGLESLATRMRYSLDRTEMLRVDDTRYSVVNRTYME